MDARLSIISLSVGLLMTVEALKAVYLDYVGISGLGRTCQVFLFLFFFLFFHFSLRSWPLGSSGQAIMLTDVTWHTLRISVDLVDGSRCRRTCSRYDDGMSDDLFVISLAIFSFEKGAHCSAPTLPGFVLLLIFFTGGCFWS